MTICHAVTGRKDSLRTLEKTCARLLREQLDNFSVIGDDLEGSFRLFDLCYRIAGEEASVRSSIRKRMFDGQS